jgi:hypothetical protein
MLTRAGTNGVDKSFSSGSRGDRRHGHVGDAVSAARPREILAVTQKSFALMQGDLVFRKKEVIGQALGDVAKLVVPQANHTSTGKRKFRIVSGDDRFVDHERAAFPFVCGILLERETSN